MAARAASLERRGVAYRGQRTDVGRSWIRFMGDLCGIDVDYNFFDDTPPGQDPDSLSPTLITVALMASTYRQVWKIPAVIPLSSGAAGSR
jgi:hypothetical protein